jgi:hypothetical protein
LGREGEKTTFAIFVLHVGFAFCFLALAGLGFGDWRRHLLIGIMPTEQGQTKEGKAAL